MARRRVVARTAPFPTLAPTRHPLDAYATQAEALEAAAKLNCSGPSASTRPRPE
jgi:hypothetical protein